MVYEGKIIVGVEACCTASRSPAYRARLMKTGGKVILPLADSDVKRRHCLSGPSEAAGQ